MKLKDILSPSFKDYLKPIKPMVEVEWDSNLCQEVVCRAYRTISDIIHQEEKCNECNEEMELPL